MKTLIPALLAGLFLCPAAASAKDAPDLGVPLPADDRMQVLETLPNGMSLWIRRNELPKGKVSMALMFDVGSLQEDDDQRGLAHYIEHMAFNGSTNFPPETLIKTFEAMGVQFGRDQNAFTSFDRVAYTLNLPNTEPANIKQGLLYFSDVASELMFTPKELDKERGVIIEELRSRDSANDRLLKRMIHVLAPNSLISKRLVAGEESVILAAKRPQFVRYYEKWYRPELATLMIVGDVDPAEIAATARAAFAGWAKREAAIAMPDSGIKPLPTLTTSIFTDPDLTAAESSINQILPARLQKTVGDMREGLVERLATYVANDRISRREQSSQVPWQDAQVLIAPFVAGVRIAIATCESEPAKWKDAQKALFEEVQRMRVHGLTDDELANAKQVFFTGVESAVATDGSTPSSSIITGWARRVRGNKPMSAKQRLALMKDLLPGITAAEVHERFKAVFKLDQGAMILTLPESFADQPSEAALAAMVKQAAQAEVAAPEAEGKMSALIETPPTPGTVVSETMHIGLKTTEMLLSNGATVFVRSMPETKTVTISLNIYGGILDETAENRGISSLTGRAMGGARAATKRHTPRQISEYLNGKKVGIRLTRGDINITATIQGPPGDDIKAGCELAHVLLTEPRIDPVSFEAAKRELVSLLEQAAKQTNQQVMTSMHTLMAPNDVRMVLPTVEGINAITIEAAQAWLDKLLAEGPMEILVTGNITLDDAKALILPYFGSLSSRETDRKAFRKRRRVVSAAGPMMQTVEVDTTSAAAIVVAGWRGVRSGNQRMRANLFHAGQILRGRMNAEIREKRGLTYTAMAGYQPNSYDGMDMLTLQFTAAPEAAASTAKIAVDVAKAFGKDGPTKQEIANTGMMMNAGLSSQMQSPRFWTSVLSGASLDPTGLSGVHAFLEYLRDPDERGIHSAAQLIMREDRFFQVIGVPKGAAAKDGESKDGEAKDGDAEEDKGDGESK